MNRYYLSLYTCSYIYIIIIRELVIVIEDCVHDTVMKDMCAMCGKDLKDMLVNNNVINTSINLLLFNFYLFAIYLPDGSYRKQPYF